MTCNELMDLEDLLTKYSSTKKDDPLLRSMIANILAEVMFDQDEFRTDRSE